MQLSFPNFKLEQIRKRRLKAPPPHLIAAFLLDYSLTRKCIGAGSAELMQANAMPRGRGLTSFLNTVCITGRSAHSSTIQIGLDSVK